MRQESTPYLLLISNEEKPVLQAVACDANILKGGAIGKRARLKQFNGESMLQDATKVLQKPATDALIVLIHGPKTEMFADNEITARTIANHF